jgi:mRNA interferase HigB
MRYIERMHIITHTRILGAQSAYPDCATALEQWYRQTKRATWRNFAEMKTMFPAVDKVGDKYVFDVGGNKLRLIAAIHFNAGKVFIRAVLTHKAYDKGDWK